MPVPPSIFISYRRDDAGGDAGRLADHLHRRFGAARVFLDIDTIDPGADFPTVLRSSLERTAAMLVVIGPRWLSVRGADGTRRLDDPRDFVRLEVATALGRGIPVVPVLVQGAALPRADDLPAPLAKLVTRQAFVLDHAEFHADAERLCDRLERVVEGESAALALIRRWWPAAIAAVPIAMAAAVYVSRRDPGPPPGLTFGAHDAARDSSAKSREGRGGGPTAAGEPATARAQRAQQLLAEAQAQRQRHQYVEALATLARARELDPMSDSVRQTQEDVAMYWMRNVRVEGGKSSFTEAIKPSLAVVDAELASASGTRRADLLAHSGWAGFLMWRDGNREFDPAALYNDALAIDPDNPYANAMLAHWILFRGDDVPRAAKLFDTALRSGRAADAIRRLQWSAYANANTPAADVELVRLADAMRRENKKLTAGEAQTLWKPYYSAARESSERERRALLEALPPEDYISTLAWAFDEYAQADRSRQQTIRFYVALLHARAGRRERAIEELRGLGAELTGSSWSLRRTVEATLTQLLRGT